jgi:hypothetical protein
VERANGASALFVDDAFLVAYGYPAQATDAGSSAPSLLNELALFDSAGKAIWQQNALLDAGFLSIAGPNRESFVAYGGLVLQVPNYSMAKLDGDGNVAWARSMPDVWRMSATRATDGGAFLATYLQPRNGDNHDELQRLDPSGNTVWTLRLDTVPAPSAGLVAADDGVAFATMDISPTIVVISGDGRQCATWQVGKLPCLAVDGDGTAPAQCDSRPQLVQARTKDAYYVTTSGGVGRVRFGAAP